MQTSSAGRKAITRREGNKLTAYKDSVGILTIGVGHTSMAGPPKVTAGLKISAAESDAILSRDLAKFEKAVSAAVKVPVSQTEFDALVSLAFNIGGGAFAKSTLVRKLNAGDRKGAADAFMSWNKAGGKVLKGLTTRRADERQQFLSKAYAGAAASKPPAKPAETPVSSMAITEGDKGPTVVQLQHDLNALGMGPISENGTFGPITKKAVEAFQATHKDADGKPLKVDGAVGLRTSKAISAALLAPKLDEAKKNIPATAPAAVKEETSFWTKVTGWLAGGSILSSLGLGNVFDADWQTIAVIIAGITALGILAVVLFLLLGSRVAAKFKEINQSAKS